MNIQPARIKYYLYARKSTDEDTKQVRSIQDQLTELKDYALKEKLNIVDIFIEKRSAKTPGRRIFNEMLDLMKEKGVSGIVSWHPDRLARNSIDGGKLIYLLDQQIIKYLKFPTFWFENTPQGKFFLGMAFNQSKYFVDNLARNVKRGMGNKAKRGEFPGKAPLGYINDRLTRRIIINKKTSRFIKKAFHLYSTGKYSYQTISDYLASKKIGRINKKTNKLEPHSINGVYCMLTKSFYYGYFKYCGEIYKGTHKALISKKLFDQVQGVVLLRSKNRKRIHSFPFTNLMKCGECGFMITAEKHTKY